MTHPEPPILRDISRQASDSPSDGSQQPAPTHDPSSATEARTANPEAPEGHSDASLNEIAARQCISRLVMQAQELQGLVRRQGLELRPVPASVQLNVLSLVCHAQAFVLDELLHLGGRPRELRIQPAVERPKVVE